MLRVFLISGENTGKIIDKRDIILFHGRTKENKAFKIYKIEP